MWTGTVIVSLLVATSSFGAAQYRHSHHDDRSMVEVALTQKANPYATVDAWSRQQQHQRSASGIVARQQHRSAQSSNSFAQDVEAPVVHKRLMSLADRLCWQEGTTCSVNTTCTNCCGGKFYELEDGTAACGEGCLADGTVCMEDDYSEYNCWKCCNGAFENGGKTCGGQCTEIGTVCDINTTCMTCCNYTYYQQADDSYMCGCKEDGVACIPGEDCYSCCNGAYGNGGFACGGTCMEDGTECTYGEDCHLCCNYYSFWYSTGKMQCGQETCFVDGTKCIPGESCSRCCNGAFDNDGTTCGGECLPKETKCTYFGTCNKCCPEIPDDIWWPSPPSPSTTNSTTEASLVPSVSPWPSMAPIPYGWFSPSSYWNETLDSMVCGYKGCLEEGTSCVPGHTCYNCCGGAYADGGKKCGGECLEDGTTCDYYSTCELCCNYRHYNATLGSFLCGFEDYPMY